MELFLFNGNQTAFDAVDALACARLSALAYEDSGTADAVAFEWTLERFQGFIRESHFAFIAASDRNVFVVFRGTDDRRDWQTNLDLRFADSPFGAVHRGFKQAADLFWPELPEWIQTFRDSGQPVWITGHSLGGALALLAATELSQIDHIPIATAYTFGQPAVGGARFARTFSRNAGFPAYRLVNHTDAVAAAPMLLRRHVGSVRYFDADGNLWEGNPPWRIGFLDHIKAPARSGGLSDFRAHDMAEYVRLLRKLIS